MTESRQPVYVSIKQIAGMTGSSVSSAKRDAERAGFPDPFYFGKRKRWLRNEVEAYNARCRRPRS
ncbi:helix-turn-helix transcriptional regulator [Sphingomonas sp.]|uniref:helix-turn-helix transcriptional regulator n=1 Tax=Sphingomonas sp. TaxID=28214 RepID=UPI0035C7A1D9